MSSHASQEKTFRAYSAKDAENYAQHRMEYSDNLYQTLFSYHSAKGGKFDTVIDVGCGPGKATFKLAETFATVIGLDPSESMISTARSLLDTKPDEIKSKVRFEVSTAEDIDQALVPDGSVDVITAATCAHWFEMPRFWATAARLLKPNGTVAIWGSSSGRAHPSTPNAAAINSMILRIEQAELTPYLEPGNIIARDLYTMLSMPWTVSPAAAAFAEANFVRREFGTTGQEEPFFSGETEKEFGMEVLERMVETQSPITRWREANPEKVGTEEDIVRRMRRGVEGLLREAGVEEGKETIRAGTFGFLLLVRKES